MKIRILNLLLIGSIVSSVMLSSCSKDDDPSSENLDYSQDTGVFKDTRDGKEYKWVKIGDQTWMAENLAYDAGSGCWAYNNDEDNVATYGRLYTWEVAKTACPSGWHLPTDAEWTELENALVGADKGSQLAGNADLWSNGELESNSQFGTSGFSALPGGYRGTNGSFNDVGSFGYWWSATESSSSKGWRWLLYYNKSGVNRGNSNKAYGFSVRCVRD